MFNTWEVDKSYVGVILYNCIRDIIYAHWFRYFSCTLKFCSGRPNSRWRRREYCCSELSEAVILKIQRMTGRTVNFRHCQSYIEWARVDVTYGYYMYMWKELTVRRSVRMARKVGTSWELEPVYIRGAVKDFRRGVTCDIAGQQGTFRSDWTHVGTSQS